MFPLGAMMAYDASVVRKFDKVSEVDAYDDDVYAHRALILGDELCLDKVLMEYRTGGGNSTGGLPHKRRANVSRKSLASARQTWVDLCSRNKSLSSDKYERLKRLFAEYENFYKLENMMYGGRSFLERFDAFRKFNENTHGFAKGVAFLRWLVPDKIYLFARPCARILKALSKVACNVVKT